MMKIDENTLHINGEPIGNERQILDICDKANKWDELKANFEKGDS